MGLQALAASPCLYRLIVCRSGISVLTVCDRSFFGQFRILQCFHWHDLVSGARYSRDRHALVTFTAALRLQAGAFGYRFCVIELDSYASGRPSVTGNGPPTVTARRRSRGIPKPSRTPPHLGQLCTTARRAHRHRDVMSDRLRHRRAGPRDGRSEPAMRVDKCHRAYCGPPRCGTSGAGSSGGSWNAATCRASTWNTSNPCVTSRSGPTRRLHRTTWTCPVFRLHPLKGTCAGFWAVTVRANRRGDLPLRGRSRRRCRLPGLPSGRQQSC